jgi:PHD-finger
MLLLVLLSRCGSSFKFPQDIDVVFQVSSSGWSYGTSNPACLLSWSHPSHIYAHFSKSLRLSLYREQKHDLPRVFLLLFSGDVESNPGPRQPKFPCGICSKAVKNHEPAVCCDQCDSWVHNRCSGSSELMYGVLQQSSCTWICPSCGLPSFTSSFFNSMSIES